MWKPKPNFMLILCYCSRNNYGIWTLVSGKSRATRKIPVLPGVGIESHFQAVPALIIRRIREIPYMPFICFAPVKVRKTTVLEMATFLPAAKEPLDNEHSGRVLGLDLSLMNSSNIDQASISLISALWKLNLAHLGWFLPQVGIPRPQSCPA